MDINLPPVKPIVSSRNKIDSSRNTHSTESLYGVYTRNHLQNQKNSLYAKGNILVESKPKLKIPSSYKSSRQVQYESQPKTDPKIFTSFDNSTQRSFTPNEKPKIEVWKTSPRKIRSGLNENSQGELKILKEEVERLNLVIENMKKIHSEEEKKLMSLIEKLEKELESIKAGYKETVKTLAGTVNKYVDDEKNADASKELINVLKEQQEKLKLELDEVIEMVVSQPSKSAKILLIEEGDKIFNIVSNESLSSTGKFQNFEENLPLEANLIRKPIVEVIALYDYHPGFSDHLSFKAGDRISVMSKNEDGWWHGKIGEKFGRFPSNYILLD
ncbi:unnamed protein product [Blepharisma stoltei]|uniref:SH3 domain-containing protein n=1 Tax=Blepharisma stoltei TaxID=1481888 RepID=A0AAU9JU94_9CILI|nr:unnamed protein product [Blepharisma stoltei]